MLNLEYKRFSKAADLRLQHERMEMSGFGSKQAREAEKYERNLQFINNDDTIMWCPGMRIPGEFLLMK